MPVALFLLLGVQPVHGLITNLPSVSVTKWLLPSKRNMHAHSNTVYGASPQSDTSSHTVHYSPNYNPETPETIFHPSYPACLNADYKLFQVLPAGYWQGSNIKILPPKGLFCFGLLVFQKYIEQEILLMMWYIMSDIWRAAIHFFPQQLLKRWITLKNGLNHYW